MRRKFLLCLLVFCLVFYVVDFSSEAFDDSVFRMDLKNYILDGSYFQNGQTKTYRISFSLSCNNNYTGSARFALDTNIYIPVLPSGFSWSVNDAYYTFGADRYDVSYEYVGSSFVRLWTSSYVQGLNSHSYVGVYLLLDISYSVPNTVTVTDSRTVTTTTDSYNVYFNGSATGTTNMSQLSKLVPMYYIEPSSNSYYVRSHTETFSGNVSTTTDYKNVYFTSPSYKATAKTTSGDLSVSYNYAYLSSVTCICDVASASSYLKPESFGVQATNSKLDTANSLLTQIRDKGGVNSDGGTHDRLDSMLTAQASASQKQQEQMAVQSSLQTQTNNLLTSFDSTDMSAASSNLGVSITQYDTVGQSLFGSSKDFIAAFDVEQSFSLTVGVTYAMGFLSTQLTAIIQAMSEFSVLYTIGMGLVIFGALFSLWRFVHD